MFAIALCELWQRANKAWPGMWSEVCSVAGEYDPVAMIRNEFQKSDIFLGNFYDVSSALPIPTVAEGIEVNGTQNIKPMQGWPTGESIANHLRKKFSLSTIQYGQTSLITAKTSKYVVLVVRQHPCSIKLVEKNRFFIAISPIEQGLAFVLKGERGYTSKRFTHDDQDMAYKWWHDFMGPFMDFSISEKINTAGMQRYARVAVIRSKE
jgi:hypothetical protein